MDELRPEGARGPDMEQAAGERLTPWEARVAELARQFSYPATPQLATRPGHPSERTPRPFGLAPAWARPAAIALLVVVVALALAATPQVRAAVVRVFQIGVVRIFVTQPGGDTPAKSTSVPALGTAEPETPPAGALAPAPVAQVPVTATPQVPRPPTALPEITGAETEVVTPEPGMPAALSGLDGRTTLDDAQKQLRFPIELPHYPADLGAPDYVFVQKHAAPVVILAWSDPNVEGSVKLSLWTFLTGTAIQKIEPETVAETTVHGRRALWTTGPHVLFVQNGEVTARRLVQGNTLIWEERNITFRLETLLPLEEAVKVAESVR